MQKLTRRAPFSIFDSKMTALSSCIVFGLWPACRWPLIRRTENSGTSKESLSSSIFTVDVEKNVDLSKVFSRLQATGKRNDESGITFTQYTVGHLHLCEKLDVTF